jgi:hypothetical protein
MQPLMAQLDSSEIHFIHDLMRKYQRIGTLHYGSSPEDAVFKREVKEFTKRLMVNRRGDSILLTAKEQTYLLQELKKPTITRFADSLFHDSKMVNTDSIFTFLHRKNRQVYDSLVATAGFEAAVKYINSKSSYKSFRFTRPLYIRNGTIMLFHFMWLTDTAGGETSLSFYKKENGQWTEWICVTGGAF